MRSIKTLGLLTAITICVCAVIVMGGCGKNSTGTDARLAAKHGTSSGTEPCVVDRHGNPVPVAPDSVRVDLYTPSFSDPTNVTNPLFPISSLHSAILLGTEDRQTLRVEVTLLPNEKIIDLNGEQVHTLESQYVAFVDGRLHEVALDWYAQDDDGAAWYLGEDVFNYDNGIFSDFGGTWLAGADGPAAMIMPADPQIGNVYRPENICGLVFEEVTVIAIGQTVNGPTGPVSGAITIEELHMDGSREDKTFAPGYGEFSTGSGKDLEAIALAIPIDALAGAVPGELETLVDGADDIFDAAEEGNWNAASVAFAGMKSAWDTYEASGVPSMLGGQMDAAMTVLRHSVISRKAADAMEAAIDVARAAYDFQLRYRPITEIDIARFELWARQILVDVEEDDPDGVKGDVTTLEWLRARFEHTLTGSEVNQMTDLLNELRAAADAEDLDAASEAAEALSELVEEF